MKRKLILFAVFLMLFGKFHSQTPPVEPGISHDLAIWRAARYSNVRYKLNLTLEKMSPALKGTIEIRVTIGTRTPPSASPASSDEIPPLILDWRKIAGHERDSTISNVTINGVGASPQAAIADGGVRVPYEETNEHLIFHDGVRQGENVIKLDFTSPILTSGSAITRYVDKEDGSEYLYSLFVPSDASTAFPVFDQPGLKAKFETNILAPGSWKVVSNVEAEQRRTNDCPVLPNAPLPECPQIRTFSETKPISTYVFAFAAGPWVEFSEAGIGSVPGAVATGAVSGVQKSPPATAGGTDLSTHIYVRKSQAEKFKAHSAEVFRLNREGITYLEEYFDYKFPFPKYDIVLIPEFPFGGMEHAGATFLREASIIFPSAPTANDYISRANVIFHEAAHQWFGDTVTMRWFDDLWLKEGFAEFMAYKTLERVMPQYNAWKAFYERNKQAAYLTDSTKGTTPIYQEIPNLSAAKSAYGNIVYRKAPSFLRQAEFYLGPDKFQTAVRAFLKKHEFGNAGWEDLVKEFEAASGQDLKEWADRWVKQRGAPVVRAEEVEQQALTNDGKDDYFFGLSFTSEDVLKESGYWLMKTRGLFRFKNPKSETKLLDFNKYGSVARADLKTLTFSFPNYQDYGYGIFLLDDKSRDYVLKNIQNEKDDFLRSMMWGALWDSVREAELDPREYVELAIKNLPAEKDEMITASVLGRVSTAMTYYVSEPPPAGGGQKLGAEPMKSPPANAGGSDLRQRLEAMILNGMRKAPALGQRLTYYRAFLNIASTENARNVLKEMLRQNGSVPGTVVNEAVTRGSRTAASSTTPPAKDAGTPPNQGGELERTPVATAPGTDTTAAIPLKTKDRFDIVTKLAILNDPVAPKLLADLEKAETNDDAKRYAYVAHAAFPTKENREKFWSDFVSNKDISESWIESAMGPFNSPRHSELSLPYLQQALAELPELKRNRKIFFVNGWLGAFIGGQKSQAALDIVNKFLADNPDLDKDLRLKILENVDVIERAVKIRNKFNN